MSSQPDADKAVAGRAFARKVVDVRRSFGETMTSHLRNGRIADKEKLEQAKLKVSAGLVNFVVHGGVLFFAAEGKGIAPTHEDLDSGHVISEADLFHLLRETIFRMLGELNKPDVNLLKVSLSKEFRECLQHIFTDQSGGDPGRFPVKIFQDFHEGRGYFIGINMRNTRSVGDDIDRIEADPELKREIVEGSRACRRSDGNLMKMFSGEPPATGKPAV